MVVSKEYAQFYAKLRLSLSSPSHPPSIEEARLRFDQWMEQYPADPEVQFEPFVIKDLPALWTCAPNATRRKILLFFIGGGFTTGSLEGHKNLMGRLSAASGAAVCAVAYRLAPEHPFPAALDDAVDAYRWLLHHPYARSRIIVGGVSAGGGLTLSLFLRLKTEKIGMPSGGVCLCPWVDLSMQGESVFTNQQKDFLSVDQMVWAAKKYAEGNQLTDPFLSPLYGDLSGLPPLFIQTGTSDLLYSEALNLAERAKKKQTPVVLDVWPDMIHAWQLFAPKFPESEKGIQRAAAFMKKCYSREG